MMSIKKPKGANFNSVLIVLAPAIIIIVQFLFGGKAAEQQSTETRKGQGKLSGKIELLGTKQDANNTLLIAFYAEFKEYKVQQMDSIAQIKKQISKLNNKYNKLIQQQNENQGNIYPLRFDSVRSVSPIDVNSVTGYCTD